MQALSNKAGTVQAGGRGRRPTEAALFPCCSPGMLLLSGKSWHVSHVASPATFDVGLFFLGWGTVPPCSGEPICSVSALQTQRMVPIGTGQFTGQRDDRDLFDCWLVLRCLNVISGGVCDLYMR